MKEEEKELLKERLISNFNEPVHQVWFVLYMKMMCSEILLSTCQFSEEKNRYKTVFQLSMLPKAFYENFVVRKETKSLLTIKWTSYKSTIIYKFILK